MTLTVLVPSRGRPDNARRLLAACAETAPAARIVIGVDEDDPTLPAYRALDGSIAIAPSRGRPGMVDALNVLSELFVSDSDHLGFLGDDHLPGTPGWDTALTAAAGPTGMAYGNDLIQCANLPTAVVMSAAIPRALGYMAPPELAHLYVDNVWLDWGREVGIRYLSDVVIEHLHPIAAKADWDAGYEAVNGGAAAEADRLAYERYRSTRLADDLAKLGAVIR